MDYDIIIIGAGPAGITAAIYALRANQKVIIIEKETIGGKVSSSPLIENYPGIFAITGTELSDLLQKQVEELGGKIQFEEAIEIKNLGNQKQVVTKSKTYFAKAIILATGTKYKTLGLPEEEKFLGKGISFCATCDGFFYRNKTVAVIGGGNSAISNTLELSNVCQKAYVIQNLDQLTGEAVLIKKLQEKNNVEILYQTKVIKLIGTEKLEQIEIQKKDQKEILTIDGMFLSIGQIPKTSVEGISIKKDKNGYFEVTQELMTNEPGVFSAGDCNHKKIRQLTTAVSDGTIAAMNAIEYLHELK